jgi:hypothetical protein
MGKIVSVLAISVTNLVFGASYVGGPLKDLIKESEMVVVGKVTLINESVFWPWPEKNEGMLNDVAIIEVSEVLKNNFNWKGTEKEDYSTMKIQLNMYSRHYMTSLSDRVEVGDEGIWILDWHPEANEFYFGYPKRLQPQEKLEEIKAIIESQKKDAPQD